MPESPAKSLELPEPPLRALLACALEDASEDALKEALDAIAKDDAAAAYAEAMAMDTEPECGNDYSEIDAKATVEGKPEEAKANKGKRAALKHAKAPRVKRKPAVRKEEMPIDPEDGHHVFCFACKDGGDVIVCEGCPRIYHVTCLAVAPPEGDEQWRCPACA